MEFVINTQPGRPILMAKWTHYTLRFLPQGKKKSLVLSSLCLMGICLVLALTVLYGCQNSRQNSGRSHGSAAASPSAAHAAGVTAYSTGTGQTAQQLQAAPSSADVTVDFGSRQSK